jgi:retinol dehydrogenase-12
MSLKQAFTEFFPPVPTFTETDLPSLSGKTYLITGGATGVGKELCRMLYSAGATVYVAGRNLKHIENAITEIMESSIQLPNLNSAPTPARILPVILDLADLPSIKPAIEELKRHTTKVEDAFLNAGVNESSCRNQNKTRI